jgi:hypothetical protein
MVALVYGAGMASEAVKVLTELSQRSKNREVLHAVTVLAQAYNEISTAYAKGQGWTEGELNSCDSAINQAFAAQIVGPDGGLIQLN